MKKSLEKEQNVWVNYVRVIATFLVVLVHSSAPILYKFNELPLIDWMVGNVIDAAARICVPLFFMVSGYLLLQKDESISLFFSKRMKKILVPMIFWSVFYVLWQSYFVTNSGFVFKDLISILFSPSYFHLWFLYTLIGVYLFTPVLRKLIKVSDNRIVLYYIGLWFMAASLVPFIEKLTGLDSRYDFSSYSGFIGYFIMGLYLGMKNYEKKHLVLAMIVIVICLIISVVGTYYLTASREGVFTGYFYGYLSPNVILSSAASFVLIKHYFGKSSALISTKFYSVIKSINDCSFGIYLVHVIFIYLLKIGYFGFELSVFTGSPILAIPMTAITVLLMSYLTVRIIRNIPYLRHVTP